MKIKLKREKRKRRHKRVRSRIGGTSERPRLSVFRSNKHIWAQLIDDTEGRTIAAASGPELKGKRKREKGKRTELAFKVGKFIAEKAIEKKVKTVVFDRGGYKYHGIIKAAAEGARKGGLKL